VIRDTSTITLHSGTNLKIGAVTLRMVSNPSQALPPPIKMSLDAPSECLELTLATPLRAGERVAVHLPFSSVIDGSMAGYYKSTWPGGSYMLTQFEVREAHTQYCPRLDN